MQGWDAVRKLLRTMHPPGCGGWISAARSKRQEDWFCGRDSHLGQRAEAGAAGTAGTRAPGVQCLRRGSGWVALQWGAGSVSYLAETWKEGSWKSH